MNALTPFVPARNYALSTTDKRRLEMFVKGPGKDLVDHEVDEAIEWCRIYQANPFVKDIYFFVFGKVGTKGRKVVPVISVGHYRKIASRTGNYRPDDRAPRITYDDALRSPMNPKGIVSAEVTVYQKHGDEWFPITSCLPWEERAPIIENPAAFQWIDSGEVWEDSQKPKKTKVPRPGFEGPAWILDPDKRNWHIMSETMIGKCTEVDALRKGWPEQFSGSYAPEEMDRAGVVELSASQVLEQIATEKRIEMAGASKPGIYIDWHGDNTPIAKVPVGELGDRAIEWIASNMRQGDEEPSVVLAWRDRNRNALKEFWGFDKAAALAVKAEIEKVEQFAKAAAKSEQKATDQQQSGSVA